MNGELPSKWIDGDTITDSKYSDGTQIHEEYASVDDLPDPTTRPEGQVVLVDAGDQGIVYRNESDEWVDKTGVLKVGSDKSSSVLAQLIGELEESGNVTITEENFENMETSRNIGSSRTTNAAPNDNWTDILPDFGSLICHNDNGEKNRHLMYNESSSGNYRIVEVDIVNFELVTDVASIDPGKLPARVDPFQAGTDYGSNHWHHALTPAGDILIVEYFDMEEQADPEEEFGIGYRAGVYDTAGNLLDSQTGTFETQGTNGEDEDSSSYEDWIGNSRSFGRTVDADDAARTFNPWYWQERDFGASPSEDTAETVLCAVGYDESAGSFEIRSPRPGHSKNFSARQETDSTAFGQGDRAYFWGSILDTGDPDYDDAEFHVLYGYWDFSTNSFDTIDQYDDTPFSEGSSRFVTRVNNQILWRTEPEEDDPDDKRNIRIKWYNQDQQILSNFSDPNNDGFSSETIKTTPYGVEAEFQYENEDDSIRYNFKKAARITGETQNMNQFSEVHASTGNEILKHNGEWYPYDWSGSGVTRKWLESSSLDFTAGSLDITLDVNTVVGHLFAYYNTFRINDIFETFESLLTSTAQITNESGTTVGLDTGTWVKYFDRPDSLGIQISASSFTLTNQSLDHTKLFFERADAP